MVCKGRWNDRVGSQFGVGVGDGVVLPRKYTVRLVAGWHADVVVPFRAVELPARGNDQ